jgi:hypothetical protein
MLPAAQSYGLEGYGTYTVHRHEWSESSGARLHPMLPCLLLSICLVLYLAAWISREARDRGTGEGAAHSAELGRLSLTDRARPQCGPPGEGLGR